MTWIASICCLIFVYRAIAEIIIGVILWPINHFLKKPYHEKPLMYYIDTENNRDIISCMPSYFSCPPWFTGSIIQSIYSTFPSKGPPFRRTMLTLPDGVEVALDIKEQPNTPETAPLVVICHGLAGGSDDPSVNMYANAFVNDLGWRCIVYVRRGHQGTSIAPTKSASETYTATFPKIFPKYYDMEDMDFICNSIYETYPHAPKILLGISVGSNLIVKYMGECNHKFSAGISLCNGIHLPKVIKSLDNERRIMSIIVVEKIKNVFKKNMKDIKRLSAAIGININIDNILRAKSISSFDKELIPLYGYNPDELQKYYLDSSCFNNFNSIKVPLLCMTALDDPLIDRNIPKYSIDGAMLNDKIITIVTERGGHLGWMIDKNNSWSTDVVTSFCKSILRHHDKNK